MDKDGWTISTADMKPSAHFEHDVAIRKGKQMFYQHLNILKKY